MVDIMSDIARQQKVASAKKKLKKFQKAKSPVSGQAPQNGELKKGTLQDVDVKNQGKDILKGIQNNHIFKTPPLTVASKTTPEKVKRPTDIGINQKLSLTPQNGVSETQSPVTPSYPIAPSEQISHTNGSINTKDKDDLEQIITSYKRTNEQLGNQVREQRKQILQLQERLKKEGQATTKLTEQKALKEQLEVHIQTIGILVSEKSELQSTVATIQKKLSTKENELNEINNTLQKFRQQVVDLEKNIQGFHASNEQLKQTNRELAVERDRNSNKLYEISHEKDDVQQQNSELHVKLQMKVEECALLLNQVNELHVKLQKGELMMQQLSSSTVDSQAVATWHTEKEELVRLINEQKDIVQKLVMDKAGLLEKHSDTESHYDAQIEQLKNKINSLEDERQSLMSKTNVLSNNLLEVQTQLETVTQENQKAEPLSVTPTQESPRENIPSADHNKITQEKQNLEKELDIQINENRRLGRVVFDQNSKIEELESKVQRLHGESTDRSSLLNQIQADKETISRALQQNKALKEQLEELEQGFVKMEKGTSQDVDVKNQSNNSADLTSKLESEQHGNKDVASKLSDVQLELEETKVQLETKSSSCNQMTEELQKFKTELHAVQMKLADKDMDIDLLNTELQTVKHDITLSGVQQHKDIPISPSSDFVERLQNELHSAQETINQLSLQNSQLKETIDLSQSTSMHNKQADGSLYPGPQIPITRDGETHPDTYDPDRDDDSESFSEDEVEEDREHARSWQELEEEEAREAREEETSEDSDFLDDHEALKITNQEIDQMQYSLKQLQEEREKILHLLQNEREKSFHATERIEEHVELKVQQELKQKERELQEHFYEQTEALQYKVQSLQEALEIMRKNEDIGDFDMASDGISMPSLKTAFMQLQKRYKSAMDAKAQLSDRIEQLEDTNRKLETETETIGEYISLYQTQRQALKTKFNEKDSVITQLSNEHARMQTKVTQLHQLVMQMLSERSGIESKNKQLQELVNRRLTCENSTTEEEVPKLQYNLDNLFGQMTLTPEEENELIKDNITVEGRRHDSISTISDSTAQQILQIFEQLETTGEGYQHGWLSPAARKHSFQPCVNCMGDIIDV